MTPFLSNLVYSLDNLVLLNTPIITILQQLKQLSNLTQIQVIYFIDLVHLVTLFIIVHCCILRHLLQLSLVLINNFDHSRRVLGLRILPGNARQIMKMNMLLV